MTMRSRPLYLVGVTPLGSHVGSASRFRHSVTTDGRLCALHVMCEDIASVGIGNVHLGLDSLMRTGGVVLPLEPMQDEPGIARLPMKRESARVGVALDVEIVRLRPSAKEVSVVALFEEPEPG